MTLRTLRETSARPLTALTALLLTAGLLAGCSSADEPAADPTPSATESTASEETSAPADEATDGASDGTEAPELSYEGREGATALDLLLEADPSAAITGEGENAFVTAVDGVAADPASEFWALYVNGEMAAVGAGALQTKDGDEITWKLETFTS